MDRVWRRPKATLGQRLRHARAQVNPLAPDLKTTVATLLVTGVIVAVTFEAATSRLQAYLLGTHLAPDVTYQVEPGSEGTAVFPAAGPYNERLGYTRIPEWTEVLKAHGYQVESQATVSPVFRRLSTLGLFPMYREKVQAGLEVLDRDGEVLFRSTHPERTFDHFHDIPPVVVETLLFIENRSLLDSRYPHRNPAVEWRRLARASMEFAVLRPLTDRSIPGASTLATQMEKFRHSPEGLTESPREKLRQMASASVRTYLDGEVSMDARRRIATDYLNSVPLAAVAGHGEVIGLADGLWAWYGRDISELNQLLGPDVLVGEEEGDLSAQGEAYREALSLLLAQRRPSWYLAHPEGRASLNRIVDGHLTLLVSERVIPTALADAALAARTQLRSRAPERPRPTFTDRKAANSIRASLVGTLELSDLYELDRLDLTVGTTFDGRAQEEVSRFLTRLHDRDFVVSEGLHGARLLSHGDPEKVQYAVTIYERTPEGNLLRVDADNFEGPFNLNRGTKLDLGSTAKLRTLVHYLEVMEELYETYSPLSVDELWATTVHPEHGLARWTVDFLLRAPETNLETFLDAAMDRRYSAGTGERFFTGGGLHTFRNFDREHGGRSFTVRDAFAHSVNLPFIRIMRDVVRHHIHTDPQTRWSITEDPGDPRRQDYLERFAHREGRHFMGTFYGRYPRQPEERTRERILETLAENRTNVSPLRLTWAFRAVRPEAGPDELHAFLRSRPQGGNITPEGAQELHSRTDPSPWDLQDLGYLARIHPLELQVARHLLADPEATLTEILEASGEERLESYRWLFQGHRQAAQNQRIRILLEEDAFEAIHRAWARLGYPFETLVPSFATAIGSSADRPDALAQLVGVLLNEGVRQPVRRVQELRFAEGTPFETNLRIGHGEGERILSPEVARTARDALEFVVTHGTGRRLAQGLVLEDGTQLSVAGKTGTGNHTYRTFGAGGRLLDERPVNRTATFVFTAGDRFFGTVTAFVSGEESARYTFTSSLPAQVLRMLGPALSPLLESESGTLIEPPGRAAS